MPRKLTVILLLVFCYLLFSSSSILAKDLEEVAKEIKEYNKKSLPPVGNTLEVNDINITLSPNPTTGADPIYPVKGKAAAAHGYSLPEYQQDPLSPQTFFEKILAWFKDLFGIGIEEIGNKKAQDYLNAQLPANVGDQLIAKTINKSQLAEGGNSNVLGQTYSDQAMEYAYDCSKCANLPLGLCDCGDFTGTDPGITPEPTVTGIEPIPTTPKGENFLPPSKTGEMACANKGPASNLFIEKFREAGEWKGIPGAIIAGVACIEQYKMWDYSDSQVDQYSREGGEIPNCTPNAGGFMGPMQFSNTTWQKHGFAAIDALGRQTTSICNITDSFFAAVHKFDQDKNQKELLGNPPANNPYCKQATDDWSDPNLICCAASRFYGSFISCTYDPVKDQYTTDDCQRFYRIFGEGMNYCEFVNRYYLQWKDVY